LEFPINLTLFDTDINTHFISEILAFIVGFRLYVIQKRKFNESDPYSSEQRLIILAAATLGALIFSRLIGALENLNEWMTSPNPLLYLYNVKTIAGGFMGGWFFVEIAKYFMKIKASSGDIMVYPIIVAIVIGRLGCFSQGIYDMTHGNETSWITGMNLGDDLIRHPLALYEIVVVLLIGLVIYLANKKHEFLDGWKFKSFMLLYFLYRFIAEYMKPHFPLFLGLTSIQLGIIITYLLNIKPIYLLIKKI
jgi:prolipoprotein diacylglyceryltransferase